MQRVADPHHGGNQPRHSSGSAAPVAARPRRLHLTRSSGSSAASTAEPSVATCSSRRRPTVWSKVRTTSPLAASRSDILPAVASATRAPSAKKATWPLFASRVRWVPSDVTRPEAPAPWLLLVALGVLGCRRRQARMASSWTSLARTPSIRRLSELDQLRTTPAARHLVRKPRRCRSAIVDDDGVDRVRFTQEGGASRSCS